MIPQFPNFKKLEFSDREEIQSFTKKFPPYSDFNFYSMWSWNTEDKFQWCYLNGNLVINLTDYITGQPFFSFMGINKVEDTADEIIKHASKNKANQTIRLVPEEVIEAFSDEKFNIVEDRDNFDYLILVENIVSYPGTKFSAKRNYVKRFENNQRSVVKEIDSSDPKNADMVIDLYKDWGESKKGKKNESEENAIKRLINVANSQLVQLGVFDKGYLIGFWVIENAGNGYGVSHFQKANAEKYIGIYPYLMKKGGELMLKREVKLLNLEQDLGLEGLRRAKSDYKPVKFLKKYEIHRKNLNI